MSEQKIIVIDFGSKSAESIAEILENDNITAEIVLHDTSAEVIRAKNPCGLILSGREANKTDELLLDDKIFEMKIPILGIAYGMQYIVRHFGGKLEKKEAKGCSEETLYPKNFITVSKECFNVLPKEHFYKCSAPIFSQECITCMISIFYDTYKNLNVWLNHNGKADKLPKNFEIIGIAKGEICVIVDFSRNIYALQFHPEAKQSKCGAQILNNFARFICGCE